MGIPRHVWDLQIVATNKELAGTAWRGRSWINVGRIIRRDARRCMRLVMPQLAEELQTTQMHFANLTMSPFEFCTTHAGEDALSSPQFRRWAVQAAFMIFHPCA